MFNTNAEKVFSYLQESKNNALRDKKKLTENDAVESEIKEVDSKTAEDIIEIREQLGQFYYIDTKDNVYVGIDNSDGEAWTEDFDSLEDCIKWLKGEVVYDAYSHKLNG